MRHEDDIMQGLGDTAPRQVVERDGGVARYGRIVDAHPRQKKSDSGEEAAHEQRRRRQHAPPIESGSTG
jgi:hypothetical protein